MCNLLASERRERERRLSCCGRRHRRSRTDGRTDGLTVKRAKFLRQTPSRSLHICRSCTQPSLAPRSPLRNVARNSLTGASSVVGRSGKGGFIEWGRREGWREGGGGGGGGHGMCGRRRGEGEEGGKLRRSRSIGQGRRGSLNGVQWRGDDTSAS